MSRSSFAKARNRDSRGRFVDCQRPNSEMLFCRRRDTVRPMAVIPNGRGFKGLFYRLSAAFQILIWGRIPVQMEENQIPYGDLRPILYSDAVGVVADGENTRDES